MGENQPNLSVRVWLQQLLIINKDRIVFIILTCGAIASIVLAVWVDTALQYSTSQLPWMKTLAAIANSVLSILGVGVTYGILERWRLLKPIEKEIQNRLGEMKSALEEMGNSTERAFEGYKKTLHSLTRHDKFQQATIKHGLSGIAGIPPERGMSPEKEEGTSFGLAFLRALQNASEGTTIYYMNTFAEALDAMDTAIIEALRLGINIKMLLMHPKDPNLVHRFNELPVYGMTVETFRAKVLADATALCEMCNERRSSPKSGGSWEIQFYSDTMNYPIVAVGKDKEPIPEYEVVYTGFYGAYSSERMPYIEWRSGENSLLSHFMEIFQWKWKHPVPLNESETSSVGSA
jgi:hypothetical protein